MLLLLIDHDREVCGNKVVASVHKLENVSSPKVHNFHKWACVLKDSLFFSSKSHSVSGYLEQLHLTMTEQKRRMTKGAL